MAPQLKLLRQVQQGHIVLIVLLHVVAGVLGDSHDAAVLVRVRLLVALGVPLAAADHVGQASVSGKKGRNCSRR